ncbi:MAG: toxin, partial [Desulfobacterales bacterium]|nr:toxin [Desulfobacterales bacterium]
MLVGQTLYGEKHPNYPIPENRNLRGKVVELRDQAGIVTSDAYDFKGNLRSSERKLVDTVQKNGQAEPAYKTTVDWNGNYTLMTESYTSRTRYDALNRPTQLVAPHSDQPGTGINVIQPSYNDANLLEQVDAWLGRNAEPGAILDSATASLHAVVDIDYDAKGQRTLIDYGNGVRTTYEYDPLTWRLKHLMTRRDAAAFPGDCQEPPPSGWPGCQVQSLHYSYDPAGNITHILDDAQQTIYFNNKRVDPSAEYTYDAVYRLIEATGREHLGQVGGKPIPHSFKDVGRVGIQSPGSGNGFHPHNGNAMGRYCECYEYDAVGNIMA